MNMRTVKSSGRMRFSHYDQVIRAAVEGSGVAIGKWPHLAQHLRDGIMRTPLGRESVARLGSFFIVVAPSAAKRSSVVAFVAWLKEEVRQDAEGIPDILRDHAPASAIRSRTLQR